MAGPLVFVNTSAELISFCQSAAGPDLEIFRASLRGEGKGYRIEIELEGAGTPPARVSLADCERVSRQFIELLDRSLVEGPLVFLPEDLGPDNYSLEISSAGAERELRLPGELERFRGQPLKIKFQIKEQVETMIAVFVSATANAYVFQEYRRKKEKHKKPGREVTLSGEDLLRANLYLDM
ncbi:MAG: hypothetical protein HS115_05825 [Spirochaetales bacterium]|nr:hypothetical protein [Spirochaetales bacterium]